jgi:hypothetical protein
MPNLPISGLPTASALTGNDVLPIVQSGVTNQITYNNLTSNFVTNSQTSSFITSAQTGSFYTTGSFGFYGAFCSTASQTNPTASISRSMQLETTELANGVSIVSGSRITVANAGVYNLQFSAVFTSNKASSNDVNVWFDKNGSTLADSNTILTIAGQSNAVAAWNYVLKLYTGDFIQSLISS